MHTLAHSECVYLLSCSPSCNGGFSLRVATCCACRAQQLLERAQTAPSSSLSGALTPNGVREHDSASRTSHAWQSGANIQAPADAAASTSANRQVALGANSDSNAVAPALYTQQAQRQQPDTAGAVGHPKYLPSGAHTWSGRRMRPEGSVTPSTQVRVSLSIAQRLAAARSPQLRMYSSAQAHQASDAVTQVQPPAPRPVSTLHGKLVRCGPQAQSEATGNAQAQSARCADGFVSVVLQRAGAASGPPVMPSSIRATVAATRAERLASGSSRKRRPKTQATRSGADTPQLAAPDMRKQPRSSSAAVSAAATLCGAHPAWCAWFWGSAGTTHPQDGLKLEHADAKLCPWSKQCMARAAADACQFDMQPLMAMFSEDHSGTWAASPALAGNSQAASEPWAGAVESNSAADSAADVLPQHGYGAEEEAAPPASSAAQVLVVAPQADDASPNAAAAAEDASIKATAAMAVPPVMQSPTRPSLLRKAISARHTSDTSSTRDAVNLTHQVDQLALSSNTATHNVAVVPDLLQLNAPNSTARQPDAAALQPAVPLARGNKSRQRPQRARPGGTQAPAQRDAIFPGMLAHEGLVQSGETPMLVVRSGQASGAENAVASAPAQHADGRASQEATDLSNGAWPSADRRTSAAPPLRDKKGAAAAAQRCAGADAKPGPPLRPGSQADLRVSASSSLPPTSGTQASSAVVGRPGAALHAPQQSMQQRREALQAADVIPVHSSAKPQLSVQASAVSSSAGRAAAAREDGISGAPY